MWGTNYFTTFYILGLTRLQSAAVVPPPRPSEIEPRKTCAQEQLSHQSQGWLAGGVAVTFVSGAISARSGRSRSPEAIVIGRKHLQALSGLGESCGSSGDGWGGAGGSETADLGICNVHRQPTTFANFRGWTPGENGRVRAAQTRHLLSHSGGKADGEEFELSLKV